MTELLCHLDSYLREFDASIIETTPNGVILDRTAFYPGGGGQPADTGVLISKGSEYNVNEIYQSNGRLIHELDIAPPPKGKVVFGKINWENRYQLMRTHTALHILCGVIWRDYGAQVTGGDMKPLVAKNGLRVGTHHYRFRQ